MDDVVIVGSVRTPFGKFGGSLRDFDCYDLSAIVMKEVVEKIGVSPGVVEEIYWGMGDTSSCKDVYTPVVARQALLKAGFPDETTSCTLDKACVSGMSAVQLGVRAIKLGEITCALCGGVTTFSREPLICRNLRWKGFRMGDVILEDPLHKLGYKDYNPVAVDAGEVAAECGVSREEQDQWALGSHLKYGEAHASEKFSDEIMSLNITGPDGKERVLTIDEQYRPDISMAKLAKLPTIYGSPTVTAGNAPGLNDGATAMLIMSRAKARELGLEPLATIIGMANAALAPKLIAKVPAAAINKVLKQTGLNLDDMEVIEINEAFAAVPLVSTQVLAQGDAARLKNLRKKVNVNGGAIAIGHANTATGARIMMTMIHELKRRGGGYGIAAICGGLAQGDASIIKVE